MHTLRLRRHRWTPFRFSGMRIIVALLTTVFSLMTILGTTAIAQTPALRVAFIHSPVHERMLESLQATYESLFRGETIELIPLSSRDAEANLARWLMTGEQADVFLLSDVVIGTVKDMSLFRHLDELRWMDMRLHDTFRAFPVGIQEVFSDERGIIGVPLAADARLFQYNQDIMNSAGLPPFQSLAEDWTWSELIDVGNAVRATAGNPYLLDIDLEFVAVYFLAHGPVISDDGRTAQILSDRNIRLWRLAQQAIHEYGISPSLRLQNDNHGRFQRQQLAMRTVTIQSMQPEPVSRSQHLWNFDWDVVPFPRSPFSGVRPALGDAIGLVVPVGSRPLPQLEQFLELAFSPEAQVEAAMAGGIFPARLDVWTQAITQAHVSPNLPPTNRGAFLTSLTDWQHFLFPTHVEADLDRLITPLAGILEGLIEPEIGLRSFEENANRILRDR